MDQISRDWFNQLFIWIFEWEGFGYGSLDKLGRITYDFSEIFLIKEVLVVLLFEQTNCRLVFEVEDTHDIVIVKGSA